MNKYVYIFGLFIAAQCGSTWAGSEFGAMLNALAEDHPALWPLRQTGKRQKLPQATPTP